MAGSKKQFTFRFRGHKDTFWTTGTELQARIAFLREHPAVDEAEIEQLVGQVELVISDAATLLKEIAVYRLQEIRSLDHFEMLWRQMFQIDGLAGTVPPFPDLRNAERHTIDAAFEVAAEWLRQKADAGNGSKTASLPNEQGYVKAPSDPSAYVSQAEILAHHTPLRLGLGPKDLVKITEDFLINSVKWTRPRSNRRSIHLVDWNTFIRRIQGTEPDGTPAVSPEEKEARQAEIRTNKEEN